MRRIFVVLLLLAACGPRPIMTWPEYDRLHTSWPYVVRIGTLYYFGAAHTFDPNDPQIPQIEAAWNAFKPDIAFTEGGNPPIEKTREAAVRKAGEPGLVRFLAARDSVLHVVESLLRRREYKRAADLCRRIVSTFVRAQAQINVVQALSYLRDAAEAERATSGLVDTVRHVVLHPEHPFCAPN